MARRISSIFSLSSSYSDQTQSSNDSRLPSSVHPARPSREQSPAKSPAKSTPNLRPTNTLQELHNNQSSGLTPPADPSLLPRIDDDHPLLQSPNLLSPIPPPSESPGGSRPTSIGSRPQSGTSLGEFLLQAPAFLKPVPARSESPGGSRPISIGSAPGSNAGSRPGSRPPSRPASPSKSRPQTPTKEHRLGRRRSWLPGRPKMEVQEQEHDKPTSAAWTVTPEDKLPYDTSALANFQKVSMTAYYL